MDDLSLLIDLHLAADRQGPGGTAETRRAIELSGMKKTRFHDLRHEATSRLFELGYSIQEVAQFTLHESWATLKRYTHLRPEHVEDKT